jgi:hypothetical protein
MNTRGRARSNQITYTMRNGVATVTRNPPEELKKGTANSRAAVSPDEPISP